MQRLHGSRVYNTLPRLSVITSLTCWFHVPLSIANHTVTTRFYHNMLARLLFHWRIVITVTKHNNRTPTGIGRAYPRNYSTHAKHTKKRFTNAASRYIAAIQAILKNMWILTNN